MGPIRWLDHLGLRKPRPQQSVEWEIEHHISELADRLIEDGMDEEEARREAERRFGDPKRYGRPMRRAEEGREAMKRRMQWWETLRQAMRSLARTAKRSPGFTLGVVLTLALGIGANATMYGIVDRLLLQPPDHVVDHQTVNRVFTERPHFVTGEMQIGSVLTYPDYADLKAHGGFERVAAYTYAAERTIGTGAEATRAHVAGATASFFPLLGVDTRIGRFFTEEEGEAGAALTAVLGAEYWERRYGGDPGVLGEQIEIEGRDHTVIGVAPRGFTGVDLRRVDVWVPLEATRSVDRADCLESRGCWWLSVVGRRADDVSVEAAQAEATSLHRNGRREMIEQDRYDERARMVLGSVIAAQGPQASDETRVARWLLGVSIVVFLIACANVANLLLARASRQRREIGVRIALGAGRRRVVGEMMIESLLLAGAGAVLAVALARWGGGIIRSTLLPGVLFPQSAVTDRLLLFTVAAAVVAGLFAGIIPAFQGSKTDVNETLREGGRGSSAGGSRLRSLLTVSQAAMSVVLLVGAGLFVRSLQELRSLDLGLDVDQLVLAQLEFEDDELTPDRQVALYEEALPRARSLPGVSAVAATGVPFQWGYATSLEVQGIDSIPNLEGGGPYYYPISPGYFDAVGLAITRGRPIETSDGESDAKVAVISETMAQTLWPEGDPLGHCLLVGRDAEQCTTVVGVVEDAARGGYEDAPFMAYYVPTPQVEMPHRGMYVRAERSSEDIVEAVASLLRSYSPQVRFANVQTLSAALDPQARAWTLGATMFTVFGVLALCLAAIGLYSVLAFDVAQRTRELGIRTALGAEKARLLRSVLFRGGRLAFLGVALGVVVALAAAPYARGLLFQVSPRDPWVLTGVAVILGSVSLAASLVPGMRATRVDPVEALKSE